MQHSNSDTVVYVDCGERGNEVINSLLAWIIMACGIFQVSKIDISYWISLNWQSPYPIYTCSQHLQHASDRSWGFKLTQQIVKFMFWKLIFALWCKFMTRLPFLNISLGMMADSTSRHCAKFLAGWYVSQDCFTTTKYLASPASLLW